MFSTLLFDLDDTLYPPTSGLWEAIAHQMDVYMHQKLGLSYAKIPILRQYLYQVYGTTMRGLQATYHIDETEFLAFVHDIPVEDYLSPDPLVRQVLLAYSLPKIIFTNADANHARHVLAALNLLDCFTAIIDILDITPYCKPMPEAFLIALHKTGENDPQKCVLLDDTLNNLKAASKLGFYTIQVGGKQSCDNCQASITTVKELPRILTPSGLIFKE